ncbi:MAG TPA: nitroreductase family deazaflavin-dependent oxidoreductase [Candidatus Limnocylindria bacterium]|nr:nitroreductase family deazaflavin-dependent oxidoreductase [Candidatus Limnocylindria bacterium]
MTRVANPIVRMLGLFPTLTVAGRRTGAPRTTPLEHAGSRYLVSGRGETDWVRNLRASRAGLLRERGRTVRIRATEVGGGERERVVAAYRRKMGHAVDEQFARLPAAAEHPVFRIERED